MNAHTTTPAPAAAPTQPAISDPALITAYNLVKTYGPAHALAGVSLAVRAGEAVVIMGPSGSGKTTLLHVLAGMILPDSGRVQLTRSEHTPEVELTGLRESERTRMRRDSFGFVFQQGLLLPELSAEDNVALAAMMKGMSRKRATSLARNWLERLGLADHGGKKIGQLSGGQAQRVAIARAQITEPGIVFADEPTGALDSRTSAEVLQTLLATTAGRGRTLIVVTHDESVAAACSRTVRLSDGQIVADSGDHGNHQRTSGRHEAYGTTEASVAHSAALHPAAQPTRIYQGELR